MRLVDIDGLEYHGCYDVVPWVTVIDLEKNVIQPGRWIDVVDNFVSMWKCSACGKWQEHRTAYCGHCGRQMEEWQ